MVGKDAADTEKESEVTGSLFLPELTIEVERSSADQDDKYRCHKGPLTLLFFTQYVVPERGETLTTLSIQFFHEGRCLLHV